MDTRRQALTKLLFAALIGLLFLLPHLVRVAAIGSFRDYTPFAADARSPTVWDETFLYASEANYMLQRHRLAYDTDAYEHRSAPFPYSVLPEGIEAGLAALTGSLGTAQIFCHFFFPAITAWLMMTLFYRLRAPLSLAAFLSLLILVVGFSPRTLISGDMDFLRHGLHGNFVDTLQAARNPHPNMSFPLFLAACLCEACALRNSSRRWFLAAGILGGLLFYAYTFYALAWSAACFLLFLLSLWRRSRVPRASGIAVAITFIAGIPFLLWTRASKASGAYWNRAERLGLIHSHLPSRAGIKLTLVYLIFVLSLLVLWKWLRKTEHEDGASDLSRAAVLVFACAAIGGIAGMNMQVVTGFNIQPEHHFPHMVIQPTVLALFAIVFLAAAQRGSAIWKTAQTWSLVLFLLLYAGCCLAQVDAGYHSASRHRVRASDRSLFTWLQRNTSIDAVVATTDLRLSVLLPVYTHDDILLVNGTRTSGTDAESLQRFLLASALVGTPPAQVKAELRQGNSDRAHWPLPSSTYAYYLFEHSPYRDERSNSIAPSAIPSLMQQYAAIEAHPDRALHGFRVDFIYTKAGEAPATIPGMRLTKALQTQDGSLWHLTP